MPYLLKINFKQFFGEKLTRFYRTQWGLSVWKRDMQQTFEYLKAHYFGFEREDDFKDRYVAVLIDNILVG